ncbi:MAG: PLP-dependent aminotransferase family protein [Chloroflexota bacterium]|nr:PLP-dependent aminotransferase family protein [Chloroflexota bacterium]
MTTQPTIQLSLRPNTIDLAWGHPAADLLPVAALQRAGVAALQRFGTDALAYGHPAGPGPLLDWLRARIGRQEGRTPAADEIMITGGNSHGLDQLLTLCTQPGDTVLVESPTYHLAVRILRDHPVNLVAVPADKDGLQVDALAQTVADLRRNGGRARLLYTVPTFHNPTGVSLSELRRRALIELASSEGLLIVEDDVYRELAYDAPAPASLWGAAPAGIVARLGSFSKSLAPGLRLGWLTAGPAIIARLTEGGLLDSGGGTNHFTALTVAMFCESGDYDAQVKQFCRAYRARRDALVAGFEQHLPAGCTWYTPGGGFFAWVMLPEQVDASELLARAEPAGLSFIPGVRFHLDGRGFNSLRLAFSFYPPAALQQAAQILGDLIR